MPFSPQDERAYNRAYSDILRFCLKLTSGERAQAEDICQTAYMRAWAAQDKFIPGTNMEAWLVTIARNEFLSVIRRSRLYTSQSQEHYDHALASQFISASQHDHLVLEETLMALTDLPEKFRDAVLLAAQGYSFHQMAEELNVPEGTAKSRVSRGRTKLENHDPKLPEMRASAKRSGNSDNMTSNETKSAFEHNM